MNEVISDNLIHLHKTTRTLSYEDIETTFLSVADNNGFALEKLKQNQFLACLTEVQSILWTRDNLRPEKPINNQYDPIIINQLVNVFIMLCNKYGGFSTEYAFSVFSDIPYNTVKDMLKSDYLSSVNGSAIEKVINNRNSAIMGKLFDSNNVTGQAMLANNILGWNTSRNESRAHTITENISTLQADFSSLGLSSFGEIAQNEE